MQVSRPGRNDPCPCGSGKKFKRCCGTIGGPDQPIQQPQTARTISTGIPLLGMQGEFGGLTVMPHFRGPADPRNKGGPRGIEGLYKVTFVLGRPGFKEVAEYQHKSAELQSGDSHLAIKAMKGFSPPDPGADRILIRARTPYGNFEFTGIPNERGFLGKVESNPFRAHCFADAEEKAYRALAPSLSSWSAHLDIPFQIDQLDSVELRTDGRHMRVLTPFREAPWTVESEPQMQDEYRVYASLYREGLNSASPTFRFLCFFKIAEGIRTRRTRLGGLGVSTRQGPPMERIPATSKEFVPWLNAIFHRRDWDELTLEGIFVPEVVGRKLNYVVDKVLEPLGNDVAHVIFDAGEPTHSGDDLLHLRRTSRFLPITRCVVRRMMKNEFPLSFLPYLRDDGTFASS